MAEIQDNERICITEHEQKEFYDSMTWCNDNFGRTFIYILYS